MSHFGIPEISGDLKCVSTDLPRIKINAVSILIDECNCAIILVASRAAKPAGTCLNGTIFKNDNHFPVLEINGFRRRLVLGPASAQCQGG